MCLAAGLWAAHAEIDHVHAALARPLFEVVENGEKIKRQPFQSICFLHDSLVS
jgi:hypothetical protein